jgi:hypothetical protein
MADEKTSKKEKRIKTDAEHTIEAIAKAVKQAADESAMLEEMGQRKPGQKIEKLARVKSTQAIYKVTIECIKEGKKSESKVRAA